MKRFEALQCLSEMTASLPLVVTCAATSRELAAVADMPNHLYLLDSMGLVGSVATGLALGLSDSRIEKVVGIEGDGSLLMNPNVLPTGGYLAPEKLFMVVLDNKVYGSTAGLPTYADRVDLGALAEASGWTVARANDPASLTENFKHLLSLPGPVFLHVQTEPGNKPDVPKLLVDPVTIANRFQSWLDAQREEVGA